MIRRWYASRQQATDPQTLQTWLTAYVGLTTGSKAYTPSFPAPTWSSWDASLTSLGDPADCNLFITAGSVLARPMVGGSGAVYTLGANAPGGQPHSAIVTGSRKLESSFREKEAGLVEMVVMVGRLSIGHSDVGGHALSSCPERGR